MAHALRDNRGMTINEEDFIAPEGQTIDLTKWRTHIEELYRDKEDYKAQLEDHIKESAEHQKMLYAHDKHALLVIFQAMDAAGKDGAIRHVFSGINPQGCQVSSFKKPSDEELEHDFLWRTTKRLPERGHIGVFNRSYYEEVLIIKVHQAILQGQKLPKKLITDNIWNERYESIRDFEKHLTRNGTKVLKFFLHLSKEEQAKRFISRIDQPEKNWKFSESDIKERAYWDEYQHAYEEAISATSTKASPWVIVPADNKKNARLIIAKTLRKTLEGLEMFYPPVSQERAATLKEIRKQLV